MRLSRTLAILLVLCLVPYAWNGASAAMGGAGRSTLSSVGAGSLGPDIDGTGLVIAIIDTGVDPDHPALRVTTGGDPKIIDWQDFTGYGNPAQRAAGAGGSYPAEGDVMLRHQSDSKTDFLSTIRGPIHLGTVRSVSGVYRYGFFRETQVADGGPLGQDLDHSGRVGEEYLVVAVDSAVPGVYDVIYVDTRRDFDLRNERAMRVSPASLNWLGSSDQRTPFVVTHIEPDGRLVNLGFDANGHGTHVAGMAAAHDPGDSVSGVAPGASIMALKALRSGGEGTWDSIARAMEYAAANGANIISVSAGGMSPRSRIPVEESRMINDLAARHDVLIIVAAGNTGPGLATISAPGGPGMVLTVGAAMTPEIWDEVYGYEVGDMGLYPFSGMGPRVDGSPAPSVLGPGAALSTVPLWLSANGVGMMEGTSMAVPGAAGAAALLWQKARDGGLDVTAGLLKTALERGASPLAGVSPLEQGSGVVDLGGAWAWLESNAKLTPLKVAAVTEPGIGVRGAWGTPQRATDPRRLLPGSDAWWVTAAGDTPSLLRIETGSPLVTAQRYLVLPPGVSRRLDVSYGRLGEEPGLYDVWVDGTAGDADLALQILHSWIQPLTMDADQGYRAQVGGTLAAGGLARHFIEVPGGVVELVLGLRMPVGDDGPSGRVRVFVFDAEGREVMSTGWIGRGDNAAPIPWEWRASSPNPGLWEVVIYSSPALVASGDNVSEYTLLFTVRDMLSAPGVVHLLPAGDGETYRAELDWEWVGRADIFDVVWGGMSPDPLPGERLILEAVSGDAVFQEIAIDEGTSYLSVDAINASVAGTRLDLFLYHYDTDTGLPQEIARSSDMRPGPGRILVEEPPPGRYGVWVEVGDFDGPATTFELHWMAIPGAVTLQAEEVNGAIALAVPGPERRFERLYGVVAWKSIRTGRLVHAVPVILEARDAYVVSVPASRLPAGAGRQLTVNVRDAETLRPVTVPVEVNGRLYLVVEGSLTLTIDIDEPGVQLNVTVRPHGDHVPDRPRTFFIEAYPAD